jgi:hypothetical protein
MEKIDVFVWVDGEDGAGASLAVRSLKARLKAPVGQWFLLGTKSERLDRLSYDLGLRSLVRPAQLSGLGAVAADHGEAPLVLFWEGAAVLTADWVPWQSGHVRIWEACPAALVLRSDLPGPPVSGWFDLQAMTSAPRTALPLSQVKVLGPEEFDKAVHNPSWPFGPSVVILEKPVPRR